MAVQIWAKVELKTSFFFHFFKFGVLVFLEFKYNDHFPRYVTSSSGKLNKRNFWDQIWARKGQN